jgi:hypothetical protein
MKKILTILMSLQLILFPVTGAIAATSTPGADGNNPRTPNLIDAREAQNSEEEPTGEEVSQMLSENNEDSRGVAHHFNQFLVLATSCTGSTLLLSCSMGWKLPSIYLFVAGAISHIVSEKKGAQEFAQRMSQSIDSNKFSDEKIKELKDSGELHLGAVDAALEDQRNLLEFATQKRNWLTAVMSLYWASALASAIEGATGTTISFASFGLGEVFFPYDWAACSGLHTATSLGIASAIAFFYGPINSMIFLGNSQVGWTMAQFLGPMIPFITILKTKELAFFQRGVTRAITFGALAAIATYVMADMATKVSDIEANIEKLKEVKKSLKEVTPDDDETGMGVDPATLGTPSGSGGSSSTTYTSGNKLPSKSTMCTSIGSDGAITTASSSCANPVKLNPPKLEGDLNMPELNDMLQNATSMANSAARGDTAGANAKAAEIGAQAGRMRDLAKKAMKRYNEIMKQQGKPQVDFDKEIATRTGELQQMFNKGLGANAPQLAASNSKAVLDAVKEDGKKSAIGPLAGAKTEAPSGPKNLFKGFDSGAPVETPKTEPTVSDNLDQYKSSVSDINNDKDVSIFALLSNRYVLSYDRVMNRKKKEEAKPQE